MTAKSTSPVFLREDGTLTGDPEAWIESGETLRELKVGDTVEVVISVKIHSIERMEGDSHTPAFTSIGHNPFTYAYQDGSKHETYYTLELPDVLRGGGQISVGIDQ